MQPLLTNSYVKNYAEDCSFDNCLANPCLCNNNSNLEPMINDEKTLNSRAKSTPIARINKSYEMSNAILSESYFDMEDMENTLEFISDYANGYKNGIILVVNDQSKHDDLQLLTNGLNEQLKHLIICKSVDNNSSFTDYPEKIEADTISNAVKTAYNKATNGQAILIQGVDTNFDFYSFL
ncbi:MAG: hypothetical protein P1P88_11165 [Bacteroidales bacterium]|nr:hypothetical protein [Bacteroidales bacterium]